MKFKEIKIHELKDFIQSDIYKNSINIPITQQRAISQFHNPRAEKEAVALIIALDKSNQIVGFIGALPDYFANHPEIKIAWNSCWWIDIKKGKQTALPLFLKFLKVWDNKVLFRELTPKTLQIIKRLNEFKRIKDLNGMRYFLRLNSAEILPNKKPVFKYFKPILCGIDFMANGFLSLKNNSFNTDNSVTIKKVAKLDSEVIGFIKKHQNKELFKRSDKELKWILDYKWITKKSKKQKQQYYYFSDQSDNFNNHIVKVYRKSILIGIVFFTNNNGLVKTPYFYCDNINAIVQVIILFLKENKAVSYITYNQKIITTLNANKNPFWYKKDDKRAFYISKSLVKHLETNFVFQDGEGDFVFT